MKKKAAVECSVTVSCCKICQKNSDLAYRCMDAEKHILLRFHKIDE